MPNWEFSGVALPKYDDTLVLRCSPIANMSNILASISPRGSLRQKMQARPEYDKTVLLGNCIIRANKDNQNINQAIEVKGCPPAENDVVMP
ncbi:MAG: hypothetical protein R2861_09845 [Desulfobacterales bacterium]